MKKKVVRRRTQRGAPRKAPSQDRSKNTVDAILRATARILMDEGYEAASTNRIAELAGVSVGSLYQYFPGKEAIVVALVDQHQEALLAALSPDPEILTLPLEEVAPKLVEAMQRAHAVNPKLHRVLIEVGPRLGRPPTVVDEQGELVVKMLLELHKHRLRPVDAELTTFIIVHSVKSLCYEALHRKPELLADPRFVDEVSQLLLRYVKR